MRDAPDAGVSSGLDASVDAGPSCVPKDETCNGLDDDCDGVADEWSDMPVSACYTRPGPWLGECRPGFTSCEGGVTKCRSEVFPAAEVCDGLDQDCDGTADNGFALESVQICLILDASGSMVGYNSGLRWAIDNWRGQADVCLVMAPPNFTAPEITPRVELKTGFLPLSAFPPVFAASTGINGNAMEPTLDAVQFLLDGTFPISWVADNKFIVVMSDEPPQAYLSGATIPGLVSMAQSQGIALNVVTAPGWTSWGGLTADGGVTPIGDAQAVLALLNELARPRCR